jgi:uncharacterized membrane protein YqhA
LSRAAAMKFKTPERRREDLIALGNAVYAAFAALAFLLMLAAGFRGLFDIAHKLVATSWAEYDYVGALHAFEMLLFAPLPFVIVVSVGRYLQVLLRNSPDTEAVEHQLHKIKSLIASLMVSIVGTELLRRFLDGKGEIDIISGVILILTLIVYFFSLQFSARRRRGIA